MTRSEEGNKPLTVGVFGGSFNPIHLGHALLAITVQQTQPVDQVVVVPVYKHAVKRNLLPFQDRMAMCELAVGNLGITVSNIEEKVGASNGAMLKGLKEEYPPGTKFLWICGDDFFRWMDRPKGLETLAEVSGLIVQRRLHRSEGNDVFVKEPIDETKLQTVCMQMNLTVDFIYGELPHFSSTLVRRAPGHWRSFLTQAVVQYLDQRPHLLQQLIENLEADAEFESRKLHQRSPSSLESLGRAAAVILGGLQAVHCLQLERGRTGLSLSTGLPEHKIALQRAQETTDALLKEILGSDETELVGIDEVLTLATELKRIPVWLEMDRAVFQKRADNLSKLKGHKGWSARLNIVEKFNPRIDVLIGATIRALTEILEKESNDKNEGIPDLLLKWCDGKEALGRLRAFVCAGGQDAPALVKTSLQFRERLTNLIDTKERCIARVLSLQAKQQSSSTPDALHKLLECVTLLEYKLMGCFATSTPLPILHKLLSKADENTAKDFDVEVFFDESTAALDFLLCFAKALAASACASA